ncbi:hypothetical protein LA020_002893 [Vibrio alginolyticus]|nr:hypothetical protein [Vibrio alginolyticus]
MTTVKVEKQLEALEPSHGNLVFKDEQSAKHRDLAKSVGRFEPKQRGIVFFDDNAIGTKYHALFRNGFAMKLTQNQDGNWFVDTSPARDMMESLELKANADEHVKGKSVDAHQERPTIMIDEKEFLQDHNDGAIDITFTTPEMKHVYTVGYLNPVTHRYTIRPDLINELDDFEYEMDEDVEAPTAVVQADSIKAPKLLNLIGRLQAEDNDDEDISESDNIERDEVYAPALGGIKALLKAMSVAKRLGDKEAVYEMLEELNKQLDELEQGDAEGIDEVRGQIEEILEESRRVSEQEFIESKVDAGRRHVSMSDEELMKQALKWN